MFKYLAVSAVVGVAQASFVESAHLEQKRKARTDVEKARLEPLVGRNLVSVVLTDLVNLIIDPSWTTLIASFVDISSFFTLPLLGGYINSTVVYNYGKDPLTYKHAGLDSKYLYASSMIFAKDWIYTATGRPDFFDIPTTFSQT